MEGNILTMFATIGFISLYLVIAAIVYRTIYQKMESSSDMQILAVFLGLLFPITIPLYIVIVWTWSIFASPFLMGEKKDEEEEERNHNGQKKENPKTKFKIGDLVTGVKGNPGEYSKFYEGCICRVLNMGRSQVKLKLVGHIDKEANENSFGQISWLPQEYFTLIKDKEKAVKKVVKKSKK